MLPPVGAAAAIFLGSSALFECEGGGLAVFGGRLLIGGRQAGDQMLGNADPAISTDLSEEETL